ncbi:MAG TPA: hypothetical protein VMC85_21985, partial [Desulfomonilaceae bacterium]|nr:hypothetical protein [Desulfomonilaceae bacterium]
AQQGQVTKEEAQQGLEKAIAYADQQKQEYIKQIQAQLDDLSKKIDQLKDKAKDAKGEALAKMGKTMTDLTARQEDAKRKWQELSSATAASWENIKTGAEKAVGDLQKAYDEAFAHFK